MKSGMDYYDRRLQESGGSARACVWSLAGIVLLLLLAHCHQCGHTSDVIRDTIRTERVDTVWMTATPDSPRVERIVRYVKIPAASPHVGDDMATLSDSLYTSETADSLSLPVVQREYADSSYTAWVSGVAVDSAYPRLDSIRIREQTIIRETTVTNTMEKKAPRLSVGLTVGYGLGINSRHFEPFIGLGVTYRLFPP